MTALCERPAFLVICALLLLLAAVGCSTDAAPTVTGVGKHFGDRCAQTEDCASGLCVRLDERGGICSQVCEDATGCPSSDNWGCAPALQQAYSVCACVPLADGEVCGDALDNDCNGAVDDCRVCDGVRVANDDHEHCGRCDNRCRADQRCSGATCECAHEATTECEGTCVDTRVDPSHCGACGSACGPGQSCVDGACACPAEQSYCDPEGCFDLRTDSLHCGECDVLCTAGQVCDAGKCVCPDPTRPDFCPGVGCVNQRTNRKYCGGCDNSCPTGQGCVEGECQCPTGQIDCDGVCVDTTSDRDHCGECGRSCPPSLNCSSGECSCSGAGYAVCEGTCARLATDEQNCGQCGVECAVGEVCSNGSCRCESGLHCGGACVPVDDEANCGACGNSCPPGQSCSAGACSCDGAGLTACGADCSNLTSSEESCGGCDHQCNAGERCLLGTCQCPTGGTYCANAGTCVQVATDEKNCGACGNACRKSEVCSGGRCECPEAGQLYCAAQGKCVDTLADVTHCGSCTTKCRATETCQGGVCDCPEYNAEYCPSQKACVDVYSNDLHCGACDRACPAGTKCSFGDCKCGTPGASLCGSACVQLAGDPQHCGSCTNVCGPNSVCSEGSCVCPGAELGDAVRITSNDIDEWGPVAAFNGTNVGVAYIRRAGYDSHSGVYLADLRFALLKPDGTVLTDTALTTSSIATSTVHYGPDLVWTGSEFGLAYTDYVLGSGHRLVLRRLDANGAPKAAAVSVSGPPRLVINMGLGGIGWSPTYGGYAATYTFPASNGGNQQAFRRAGPTGDALEPELISDAVFDAGDSPRIAVGPDGTWGIHAFHKLLFVKSSGTLVGAPVSVGRGTLVHDGYDWLDTYANSAALWAIRGINGKPFTLSIASGETWDESAATMVGGTLAVAFRYRKGDSDDYRLRLQRFSVPSAPGSTAITKFQSPIEVVPSPNLTVGEVEAETRNFNLVATGSSSLLVVWADNRWGASKEIYARSVKLKTCP